MSWRPNQNQWSHLCSWQREKFWAPQGNGDRPRWDQDISWRWGSASGPVRGTIRQTQPRDCQAGPWGRGWGQTEDRLGHRPTLKILYTGINVVICTTAEFLLLKIELKVLFTTKKIKRSHFSFSSNSCIQSYGKLQWGRLLSRPWGTETLRTLTLDLPHHHKLWCPGPCPSTWWELPPSAWGEVGVSHLRAWALGLLWVSYCNSAEDN